MGDFDQAARYAARAEPDVVLARLLRESGLAVTFREWLDTRTVPLPGGSDRTADLVAAADDPTAAERPWLFVLEFQAQVDADKLDVTREEVAILRSRVRFGHDLRGKYKVGAGLIYLWDRCPEETVDMRFPDGSGTRHAPRIWNVAEDNAAETLDAVAGGAASWGMVFWVPLMAGGADEAIIARWKDVAVAKVENRTRRGDLAEVALVFAELAGRRIAWNRALEDFDMLESQVVQEWVAKGAARGALKDRRELLLRALNKRFPGVVPADVTKLINEQESLDLLGTWFDATMDANTFDDFMAVLKK
jgi:hypothetical protein